MTPGRFIYIRKQRRNSGAHGGQCIIKSEHEVIILQSFITPIQFEVDWLMGILFNQDGKKYAVLSVYIP